MAHETWVEEWAKICLFFVFPSDERTKHQQGGTGPAFALLLPARPVPVMFGGVAARAQVAGQ